MPKGMDDNEDFNPGRFPVRADPQSEQIPGPGRSQAGAGRPIVFMYVLSG